MTATLRLAVDRSRLTSNVSLNRYPRPKVGFIKQQSNRRHTPADLSKLKEGEGGGRNNYLNDGVFADAKYDRLTPELGEEWRAAGITCGLPAGEVNGTIESAKRAGESAVYAPAGARYSNTDTGNGQYFATANEHKVLYDHTRKRWFLFKGHHWELDRKGEVDQLALETVHERQHQAVGKESFAYKFAFRSLSSASRRSLLYCAQSEPPISITGDEWDTDPMLIGVKNGVVDLRTGQRRDGTPQDYITKTVPVAFDKAAPRDKWIDFLASLFPDNPEIPPYMKRVVGYTLTGDTSERCFWVWHGVGANGKTTLLEALSAMFGPDFCWNMPFPSAKWSDALSEYQKAELAGTRFVKTSELSQQKELNSELIKSLTGNESINARRVRERPFNFKPEAKFFMAVNDPPVIEDTSAGMWDRVKVVPFNQRFTVDRTIAPGLLTQLPGILAWAVEGCVEWQRDGLLHPDCVVHATQEYQHESDPFQGFIDEHCTTGTLCSVGAAELYQSFKKLGVFEMSQTSFGKRVATIEGVRKFRSGNAHRYHGIGLLDNRHDAEGDHA